MVRIAVKVGRGAVRYRVAVQAERVGRALEIVEGLNPGGDFRVTCSIDPEAFCVGESRFYGWRDRAGEACGLS